MKKLISRGKCKSLYSTDVNTLLMKFEDSVTAGDGAKKDTIAGKGRVNCNTNSFIMNFLNSRGIVTHHIEQVSETESSVKKLNMFPVECVVRNVATGSLCRRLGVESGLKLNPPLFEFFLKNDELGDPLITEDHIKSFKWATEDQIQYMRIATRTVNSLLVELFKQIDLDLIDFKLEFGVDENNQITLGDEFTLDGCRLWSYDKDGNPQSWDKDLFRKDEGDILGPYNEVLTKLYNIT